jgi:hypothetical protein
MFDTEIAGRRSPFANPYPGTLTGAPACAAAPPTARRARPKKFGKAAMNRLSDKIIAAHEQACEQGKLDVARHLLQALELDLSARGGPRAEERDVDAAVAAAFQRQSSLENAPS